MGGVACSLFDDTEPITLAMHHGRPLRRRLYGKDYWVIPMYHPALGMHDTRQMTPILEDWITAGQIIRGEFRIPKDPFADNTDYRLVNKDGLLNYLFTNSPLAEAIQTGYLLYGGLDTETDAGQEWCITISVAPGTGVMIMADDHEAIAALQEYQRCYHWFIHNASFDIEVLEHKAKHPLLLNKYSCTQQAVYHRGNLAQGLKVLGYRLFGIQMTSYEDTVLPWSKKKLMDWWVEAMLLTGDEIVTERISEKTGKPLKPIKKTTKVFKRLLQIYNSAAANPEYNPWKQWDVLTEPTDSGNVNATPDEKKWIEDSIGPPPRESIIHVPTELAAAYACLDSDVGLRLGLHLRKDERLFRKRAGFKR